jgi:hypothetical protein
VSRNTPIGAQLSQAREAILAEFTKPIKPKKSRSTGLRQKGQGTNGGVKQVPAEIIFG